MSDGEELVALHQADINTTRGFYANLLAVENGMEGAAAVLHNRGRWLEALRHLREARASLEQFISERIAADLRQAQDTADAAQASTRHQGNL